jgi:hypothetical protein
MPNILMQHEIGCDVDRFWQIFLDREFNETLFKHLGFPKWKITEQRETDAEVVRIIEAIPKLDAPGSVKKVLGDGFGYSEEGRFDRAKKVFKFTITPNTLAGKLKTEGTVRAEPAGERKCKRIVDIFVEAKVFGVGGMLEKMSEKSLRDGWADSAAYLNRWLKEH